MSKLALKIADKDKEDVINELYTTLHHLVKYNQQHENDPSFNNKKGKAFWLTQGGLLVANMKPFETK